MIGTKLARPLWVKKRPSLNRRSRGCHRRQSATAPAPAAHRRPATDPRAPKIEITLTVVLRTPTGGVLIEHLGRRSVVETGKAQAFGHLGNDPQSARASPGAGMKARWREIWRSELVTVPSFSPHASAGSRISASACANRFRQHIDTTRHSHLARARRTGRCPAD